MLIQPGSLRFAEYLKQLPPAWVIEHFFTEKTAARKILSSAMIDECARKYSGPEELRRRFHSLDNKQRLRCARMYLMGSLGCATDIGCGLDDPVVAAFLGYAARDEGGRLRVFGFDAFEPVIRDQLSSVIVEAAARDNNDVIAPVFRWRCCNDIALTVSLASQHLLIRKRSGSLGKAALQLVKKLIHTGEMHKTEDVDAIAGLIIDYCIARQFLAEEELEYKYLPAAFSGWLTLPVDQRIDDVVSFCVSRCGGWNRDLLLRVCETAGTRWLSDGFFPEDDRQLMREMLLLYQFIGTVEVRKHGTELLFQSVRETVFEPSAGGNRVVVMPDFTVVVQQECLPEDLFAFACFCRMHSLDRVYHGSIEKGVLTEALSGDMEETRIVGSLKQWNAPVNVIESVREWIREFGRLSLLSENVLVCADATVSEQIASYEQLQPLLERVPAHSVFRVKPGSEKTVRDIIRKLGFDERMPRRVRADDGEPVFDDGFPDETEQARWSLVVDNEPSPEKAAPAIRGSKYGAELKALELSETVQVIDYAILTSQRIAVSYDGSPYLRKGMYTLTPIVCSKGPEPLLDAQLQRNGTRKQFYVRKIGAIGVIPQ